MINIRFRQLRAFLAVVDTGSVSDAAMVLSLTQSSVSKLIAGLELEIGFALFDRLGRRLKLTEQGRMFLSKARDGIETLDSIRTAAEDIRENQGKRLRICAIGPLSFGQLIPRALAKFAQSYPEFLVSFETKFRIEIEDWVGQGHSDIGFTLLPAGHASLSAKKLPSVNIVAIAPDTHPLAQKDTIAPRDLIHETVIMPHAAARVRVLVEADFLNAGHRLKPKFETSNALSAVHLAAQGVGIAVLDPFSLSSVPPGPFKTLAWGPQTKLTYGMIWQNNRSLLPHETHLFELVEEVSAEIVASSGG